MLNFRSDFRFVAKIGARDKTKHRIARINSDATLIHLPHGWGGGAVHLLDTWRAIRCGHYIAKSKEGLKSRLEFS